MINKNYVKFPCPVCDCITHPLFSMKDRFNILLYISVCPNDGLIFLNPRWTIKQYEKYYTKGYDHMKRKQIFQDIKPTRKMYKHGRSIYKRVKKYCRHPESILDIGAGNGYTLDFLRDVYKVKTYFIEPSIECQKQINERGHTSINFGVKNKFDLLTSRHVIEHVNDPIQHLKDIRLLMHDDSIFHIAFPNGGKLSKVWFQVPHIYYFNKDVFDLILSIVGFKIIKCNIGENELWYILKKCDPYDYIIEDESRYKKQINKIIKASKIRKCKLNEVI